MYCQHCGKEIEPNVTYCPHCGGVNNQLAAKPVEVHVGGSSIYECPRCHSTDVTTEKGSTLRGTVVEFFVNGILGMVFEAAGVTFLANLFYFCSAVGFLYGIVLLLRKIFSPGDVWHCECNVCHEKYKVRR